MLFLRKQAQRGQTVGFDIEGGIGDVIYLRQPR